MKRKIVLLLAALTVASVAVGCGNNENSGTAASTEASIEESTEIIEAAETRNIVGMTGSISYGIIKEVTEPYTVPVIEFEDGQIDALKAETVKIEDYLNPGEKVLESFMKTVFLNYDTDNELSLDNLTDENCEEITGFESVGAFKEAARESYNAIFKEIEKEELNDIISTKVLSAVNNISGLDEYIFVKTNEYLSIIDNMSSNSPEVMADYIASLGYEDADGYINDTIGKIAENTPKDILYTNIAEKNGFEVDASEFDNFLDKVAKDYNITKPALLSLFSTEYSTGEDYWKHQYIVNTVADDIINDMTIERTECGDDLIERFFF